MIVCSCNVLTDHDVRSAVNGTDEVPRTTHQVYGCLGCRVECGRRVATIRKIMESCDRDCGSRLPCGVNHGAVQPDQTVVAL